MPTELNEIKLLSKELTMKYLDLPIIGKTARIALGCDHYGETIDETIALKQLDIYLEKGGNLLDTARLYGQKEDEGPSTSELLLGRYLKTIDRNNLIIATKGGHPHIGHMDQPRLDRKSLTNDITASLEQLGTAVDIYFLHRDWNAIPVGEIIETLNEFISLGYTKTLGASNWSTERIEEANEYAKKHGLVGFSFSELQYSLASTDRTTWGDDTIEIMNSTSSISYYEKSGMPYLCFASQGKGIFSKVLSGQENTLSERARSRFLTPINRERINRVGVLSARLGEKPEDIVLSYITSQSSNSIAIIGSSKPEQIKSSLTNPDLVLTEEMLEYLDLRKDTISL